MPIPIIPREQVDLGNPEQVAKFQKFICPPKENPSTPDSLSPDVTFYRKLMVGVDLNLPVPFPGGTNKVVMQVIADNAPVNPQPEQFPSPLIRVRQGQIVHTVTDGGQDGHTIHHHGIEPTPMNDGVGKDSFELGSYTYQWQPKHAGTYFYHCHKNTTLHVELGMYGFLIVDPPAGAGFITGFNPANNHLIPYDVEVLWAVDEIDPRWHSLGHNAYMTHCGANPNDPSTFTSDGILHDFRPNIFVISGIPVVVGATQITDPRVQINASVGQTILMRIINAGYTIQQFTLGLDANVISMDGRPLGVPPFHLYSRPFSIAAGAHFRFTSGRRWDLIMRPTNAGRFPVQVDFFDWVTGVKYATARTVVNVV